MEKLPQNVSRIELNGQGRPWSSREGNETTASSAAGWVPIQQNQEEVGSGGI